MSVVLQYIVVLFWWMGIDYFDEICEWYFVFFDSMFDCVCDCVVEIVGGVEMFYDKVVVVEEWFEVNKEYLFWVF